jgi:aryl-alcohol dehydrogenase-like predicted oxidoreductase
MQEVKLAHQLVSSHVGFGCAGLMREPSMRRRHAVLAAAFEHGIRHFDVARMYGLGAAEAELGRFLNGRREQVVIATKFGIEPGRSLGRLAQLQAPARELLARFPALREHVKRRSSRLEQPHRYDVATARRSLETSLRELRTDYIDILFVHGPSAHEPIEWQALCAFLEDARRAGLVRAWGLAGEHEDCSALARGLPDETLLQVREDIFSRERARAGGRRAQLTYGALANALARIVDGGSTAPRGVGVKTASSRAPGTGRTDALATLLLADALQANADGVVLYSTTKPERMHTVNRALSCAAGESEELRALREHLAGEPVRTAVGG